MRDANEFSTDDPFRAEFPSQGLGNTLAARVAELEKERDALKAELGKARTMTFRMERSAQDAHAALRSCRRCLALALRGLRKLKREMGRTVDLSIDRRDDGVTRGTAISVILYAETLWRLSHFHKEIRAERRKQQRGKQGG